MQKKGILTIVVLVIIALAVIIPCIVCGFKAVDYGNYGLKMNNVNKKVDLTKVYEPGRYYINIFNGFKIFPSTYQRITKDDITVVTGDTQYSFDVAVSYKIVEDSVKDIYSEFQTNDKLASFLTTKVSTVLINYCNDVNYTEFYTDRESLEAELKTAITPSFNQAGVDVIHFQLRGVEFSDRIETQILNSQVKILNVTLTNKVLEVEQIKEETKILAANAAAQINQIYAVSNQTAKSYEADVDAQIIEYEETALIIRLDELIGAGKPFSDYSSFSEYEMLRTIDLHKNSGGDTFTYLEYFT